MMPRFLTHMFEDDHIPSAGQDGADVPSGSEGEAEAGTLGGDIDTNLDLNVEVHAEVGGTWDTGENSGSWSHSTDVVLTTSTDVLLGTVVGSEHTDQTSEQD